MKFDRQTRLKSFLEITGPAVSSLSHWPFNGRLVQYAEAYLAFLRGKGGQGGVRSHHWEITAALRCIFGHRPIVFDAGANVGEWSRQLVARRPDARTYQIEPQSACQAAIRELSLPNSTLLPVGLGETSGEGLLYSPSDKSGIASMHTRCDSRWKDADFKQSIIRTETLGGLMDDNEIEFLDYLKMDIEGHELAALMGAAPVLQQKRLGAVAFEFGPGNINSKTMFIDFFELLSAHGFVVSRVRPGGRLTSIPEYDEDCEFFRGSCNYVAVLREHPKAPVLR